MSEDESVARLRKLGLNLYESRAYLALLNAKELTAKGVGQSALIPQSRTYDVLESLTRRGFAQATPSSPPAYVAVPPAKILAPYYDSERKKIQDRATRVHEQAQSELEDMRDAYLKLTKDFPATSLGRGQVADRVWVLQERANIEDTLVELIRESKSEVLRITKPPEPKSDEPLDPFYIVGLDNQKSVYDALERNVEMKWLSLTREIPTYLGMNVAEPPERRYLESEADITEKFLLVDRRSVLLNLHDPMSPAYGQIALAMQSKAVASIFRDHFEKMWEKGRPLSDVLPKIRELVEDVCAQLREIGLGEREVKMFRILAESGALAQDALAREMAKRRVQQQEVGPMVDRMVRMGLVHRDGAHRLLMVEHPAGVRVSISTGKLGPDQVAKLTTRKSSSGKNS